MNTATASRVAFRCCFNEREISRDKPFPPTDLIIIALSLIQFVLITELKPRRTTGDDESSPRKDPSTDTTKPEVEGMMKLMFWARNAWVWFDLPTAAQEILFVMTIVKDEPIDVRVLANVHESEIQKDDNAALKPIL